MAGFWRNFSDSLKGTHGGVSSTIAGPVGDGAGIVGKATGKVLGAAGTVSGGTIGAVSGTVSGVLTPLKKPAKIGAIILAVGAVAGIVGHYFRKSAKRDQPMPEPVVDIAPPMPDMSSIGQQTMMGLQPQPGALAAREDARRQAASVGTQVLGG